MEPQTACSTSQELNHTTAAAAATKYMFKQKSAL